MDDVNLIEKYERDIQDTIDKMHKVGVRYSVIIFILREVIKGLEVQEYAEAWLREYNK